MGDSSVTGVTAIDQASIFTSVDNCDHAFIRDEMGGLVCCHCGLVDEENFTHESHLLVSHTHVPLYPPLAGPATLLGFRREQSEKYHHLARRAVQTGMTGDSEIYRYFSVYLGTIESPLPIGTCMADYHHVAPHLPSGKPRWVRILCAVLIINRMRSRTDHVLRIRPLLREWGVSRHDFMDVEQDLFNVPVIRTRMKSRSPPRLLKDLLTETLQRIFPANPPDLGMVRDVCSMLMAARLGNHLEYQIAAALLAHSELHSHLPCVTMASLLQLFPHLSREYIWTVKRLLIKRLTPPEFVEEKSPVEELPISHDPMQLDVYEGLPHHYESFLELVSMKVSVVIDWFRIIHLILFSFSLTQTIFNAVSRGKRIGICQSYFPPPIKC